MKNIRIQYFAALREQATKSVEDITTSANTPSELYHELAQRYGFTLGVEDVKVAVNDAFVPMTTNLRTGDHLVYIPPVSGG